MCMEDWVLENVFWWYSWDSNANEGGGAREGARYFFYEMNLLCCCWTSNGNVWHCCLPVYKRIHERVWISPDRTEMVLLLGRFFFYRTFSDTIKKTETRLFDDSFDLNAPVVKTLALGKKKFDGSLCGPAIRSRWCMWLNSHSLSPDSSFVYVCGRYYGRLQLVRSV